MTVGVTVTGVEYLSDLEANRSRLMVTVRLDDDAHEEALVRRLGEFPSLRRFEVVREEYAAF